MHGTRRLLSLPVSVHSQIGARQHMSLPIARRPNRIASSDLLARPHRKTPSLRDNNTAAVAGSQRPLKSQAHTKGRDGGGQQIAVLLEKVSVWSACAGSRAAFMAFHSRRLRSPTVIRRRAETDRRQLPLATLFQLGTSDR